MNLLSSRKPMQRGTHDPRPASGESFHRTITRKYMLVQAVANFGLKEAFVSDLAVTQETNGVNHEKEKSDTLGMPNAVTRSVADSLAHAAMCFSATLLSFPIVSHSHWRAVLRKNMNKDINATRRLSHRDCLADKGQTASNHQHARHACLRQILPLTRRHETHGYTH